MRCRVMLCIAMLLAFSVYAQDNGPNLGIIPSPVAVSKSPGKFVFTPHTRIITTIPSNKAVVFLEHYLKKEWHLTEEEGEENTQNGRIVLTDKGAANLPAEGYTLTITPDQVVIVGKGAGLFYGIQTFIQLFPLKKSTSVSLPCVTIEDYPRFAYRGMHLDVSRHFFPVEVIKEYIDVMAAYKLNNFHWHLTDDQGWRIEIKQYPRLTSIGSVRAQTLVGGHYWDRMPQFFDQTPYGGYYTQEEVKAIVQYAADRYVNIIPEIEMPGHSSAVLAAYPELSCQPDAEHKVAETFGVFTDIYCPTEATFTFLENVLTEVMALFPGKYIHIGGDEVPKDAWEESKFAQTLIKEKKLKDEHGLQSYFIHRIEKFLNAHGRQIIGWDEILEGGLAPNATVMSWQGEEGGIVAARQHHDVIMCSQKNNLYFNDRISFRSDFEKARYQYDMKELYRYNPVPKVLTKAERQYIKGVQGAIWTEYVVTPARLEFTLLPKMIVLSEVAWTQLDRKDYQDFAEERLPIHLARLDRAGKHYRVPKAIGSVDTIMEGTNFNIALKPSVKGAKIYYTTNGFAPTELDKLYTKPLRFHIPPGEQRELQTIVVTPSKQESDPSRTILFNDRSKLEDLDFKGTQALYYTLYEGDIKGLEGLKYAQVVKTDTISSLSIPAIAKEDQPFGVIYHGFLNIKTDGEYFFEVATTGEAQLIIDNHIVVDTYSQPSNEARKIPLLKGFHEFELKYLHSAANDEMKVWLTKPGEMKEELPKEMMVVFFVDPAMTGIDGQ